MDRNYDKYLCAVEGCYGPRLPGKAICSLHLHTKHGDEAHEQARRHEARILFHQRKQLGDYDHLFDESLRAILAEAGDDWTTTDELGAVRYALAKLLAEEDDARQLSMGVARLVGAAATLLRTRVATEKHDPLPTVVRVHDRPAAVASGEDDPLALDDRKPAALPASADTLDLPDEGWPVYPGEGPKTPGV